MANLQLPINHDHEVLGSEYCSGYMDALGKWNNGFYCPASDESQDVFCCGTESHKYCCTKKDQVIQSEVQDLTVLIGILVGASAAIMIITLVSCFCCSCCLLYKKRNPSTMSMYRLHNSSEHSGVTNMYSLSQSRSGTPTQVLGGSSNQTAALLHSQPPAQPGILVGGANHPSNNPASHHAASNLGYPHLHNHATTASQFTLQLDELDQMQMMQHQPGIDSQVNGGMSHSHTLPHNLSHQRYRASPDIISHQVTTRPHGAHYHAHHHNQHSQHQPHHHQEAVHQHYNTMGRMPTTHHHQGTNNQGFDMITGLPTNAQVNMNADANPGETITTSFIGNVDILEPTSNTTAMEGLVDLSSTVSGSGKHNTNIQQPQVVYATHGSHHHHHEAPKEDQQLFHSTKF